MRVIVHSGMVSPELAAALATSGVDGVMLDVIGADETLREVYHLELTVADVERSLHLLAAHGLRLIPHIVLGLHFGRFLGELRALEMVTAYPVSTLVLVVLAPLAGTPMAESATTSAPRVGRLFRHGAPGGTVDADQPRLRSAARPAKAGARPGRGRPRAERHRVSGRRSHRVREVPGPDAAAVRVLLLAHLGKERNKSAWKAWRWTLERGVAAAGRRRQ